MKINSSHKESGLLIKGVSETIKNESTEQSPFPDFAECYQAL